jgi:hypothetical protein
MKYQSVHITREYNSDIFTQIDLLVNIQSLNNIALYTIEFVRYILERYHFSLGNIFLALEKAKFAQLNLSDLSLWFTSDIEV